MRLVGRATFPGAEDDGLTKAFDFDGCAQTLCKTGIGFSVDGVVSAEEDFGA